MDEETIEVPLPEGTRPDPDTVVTQEIPIPGLPRDTQTLVVEMPPTHLLGDPIFTMGPPQADETPLYDQLNGPPPPRKKPRSRRRLQTADKFLIVMGAVAVAGASVVYGMVVYGWGSGSLPDEEAAHQEHRIVQTPSPVQTTPTTTPSPTPRQKASEEPRETIVVVAPTHRSVRPSWTPRATRTAIVRPSPTTSSPEPTRTHTSEPAPTRTSPAPSVSPTVSPSASPSPSPKPSLPLEP